MLNWIRKLLCMEFVKFSAFKKSFLVFKVCDKFYKFQNSHCCEGAIKLNSLKYADL